MSNYSISQIYPKDKRANRSVDALLQAEGIRRDANLDYTCGMYDEDMNIIATGSCFCNTLRCLAVSSSHQGEGLMNQIMTHLIEKQYERGNLHLFLYTKCNSARFFGDLGFYEIAKVQDQVVFMENQSNGFSSYLKQLEKQKQPVSKAAALVMNANPFTLGHQYLVEKAASENDILHLFIVSEEASLIPFPIRKRLVQEGTAHLKNICYHDSGPYIISNATFPSYFQKDELDVIKGHARLDLEVFKKIALVLGINRRYVGEEPNSLVTAAYNQIMSKELPQSDIECIIIPRKSVDGRPVSASFVRKAIQDWDMGQLEQLVPESTLRYLTSQEARPVIEKIQKTNDVIHY